MPKRVQRVTCIQSAPCISRESFFFFSLPFSLSLGSHVRPKKFLFCILRPLFGNSCPVEEMLFSVISLLIADSFSSLLATLSSKFTAVAYSGENATHAPNYKTPWAFLNRSVRIVARYFVRLLLSIPFSFLRWYERRRVVAVL